jgi:putative chitinase
MNRSVFFDIVRKRVFGGRLAQRQVDGMGHLLDIWNQHYSEQPVEYLAYALATSVRETGYKMQPVKEDGGAKYFFRMYDINGSRPHVARALGNTQPGDGARFAGRGYPQTTGRTNYEKISDLVRKVTGENVDLVKNPDLLLQLKYAGVALYEAMLEGTYTGRKLSDYKRASSFDAVNARRIINGTDHAHEIAGFHDSFMFAINAAIEAVPEDVAIAPEEPATGKPLNKSKTAGGAAATGVGGVIIVAKELIEPAKELAEQGQEIAGIVPSLAQYIPMVFGIAIIVGAGYLIYNRWKDAQERGV